MRQEHREEYYIKKDRLSELLIDERSLFVNIETTGFSPSHSQVYLIGCAYRKDSRLILNQFFAESQEEEQEILACFLEILKDYETLVSFNGVGFDIPFLKAKCDSYGMEEHFSDLQYLDIFKSISELKPLLQLPNYKQRTLEEYLDIHREDPFSGGDLINVYYDYQKQRAQQDYHTMILHNYEAIFGMADLLPMLSYLEIFHGQYAVKETSVSDRPSYDGTMGRELTIRLRNDYSVPRRLALHKKGYYFQTRGEETLIRVPIHIGELFFFYPHFTEYYYLPDQDIAVPRDSPAIPADSYREQAKPSNCYKRKKGEFLPEYEEIIKPVFRKKYEDPVGYFELNDDFISSDVLLRRYVDHILHLILS